MHGRRGPWRRPGGRTSVGQDRGARAEPGRSARPRPDGASRSSRQRPRSPRFAAARPCRALTRAFAISSGSRSTTSGRSSSMNSKPTELWSVTSASATNRYGEASGRARRGRARTRRARRGDARQSTPPESAPPVVRTIVELDDDVDVEARQRRESTARRVFSDECGDQVGAYSTVGTGVEAERRRMARAVERSVDEAIDLGIADERRLRAVAGRPGPPPRSAAAGRGWETSAGRSCDDRRDAHRRIESVFAGDAVEEMDAPGAPRAATSCSRNRCSRSVELHPARGCGADEAVGDARGARKSIGVPRAVRRRVPEFERGSRWSAVEHRPEDSQAHRRGGFEQHARSDRLSRLTNSSAE